MLPTTLRSKIHLASLCANVTLTVLLVLCFLGYKDLENASLVATNAEAGARLHGGILNLQNFKDNQHKPPAEFIIELKEKEASVFLLQVKGLAWLDGKTDSGDESLVRLKQKLQIAREFIIANPDLFSTNLISNPKANQVIQIAK
jgi:hypothetical protein